MSGSLPLELGLGHEPEDFQLGWGDRDALITEDELDGFGIATLGGELGDWGLHAGGHDELGRGAIEDEEHGGVIVGWC